MVKFFKNNQKLTSFLYVMGFCTSGIFTLLLLVSGSTSNLSKLLAVSMTCIFEFGKGITFMQAENTRYSESFRKFLYVLWIALTLSSILASFGFFLNESNGTLNNVEIANAESKSMQEQKARIENQITLKKDMLNKSLENKKNNANNFESARKDVSSKIDSYNKTIKDYQSQINTKNKELQTAIGKGFVDQKIRIEKEIAQLNSNIDSTTKARDNLSVADTTSVDQNNIDSLNREIDGLNKQLDSIAIKPELKVSDGYLSVYAMLADLSGYSVDVIKCLLNLFFSVLLELLCCVFYKLSKNSIGADADAMTFEKVKKIIDDGELGKLQKELKSIDNSIPATCKKSDNLKIYGCVDKKIVKRYIDEIFENGLRGYQTLSGILNISESKARTIHGHLKHLGIIESVNRNSYLKASKADCYKLLELS